MFHRVQIQRGTHEGMWFESTGLSESGGEHTPRNAHFTGLSAISTLRMTSKSDRSPAMRLFPVGLLDRRDKKRTSGGSALGTIWRITGTRIDIS